MTENQAVDSNSLNLPLPSASKNTDQSPFLLSQNSPKFATPYPYHFLMMQPPFFQNHIKAMAPYPPFAFAPPSNLTKNKPSQSRRKKLDFYSFDLDDKIGTGYSSTVYRGRNDKTQENVCIKIIDYLGFQDPSEKNMVQNQIKILRDLDSQNIMKFYDVLESKEFCYIVTQLCDGGDLYRRIVRKGVLSESEAVNVMRGVAQALQEMKRKGVIHRDLKPSNILMKGSIAKLSDFGFSIYEKYSYMKNTNDYHYLRIYRQLSEKEKFNLGSPIYMSPQVLKANQYSFASDVFAFGITFFELMHKVTPWETETETELMKKMESETPCFKEGVSEKCQDLIKRCIELSVKDRMGIEEILRHPLFEESTTTQTNA